MVLFILNCDGVLKFITDFSNIGRIEKGIEENVSVATGDISLFPHKLVVRIYLTVTFLAPYAVVFGPL